MSVLESWKDSGKVFLPTQFKLFFLITINTIWLSGKTWLAQWWWLLVLYLTASAVSLGISMWTVFSVGNDEAALVALHIVDALLGYLSLMLWLAIFWTLILSIRPSVLKKTYSYYIKYSLHELLVLAVYLGLFFVVRSIDGLYIMLQNTVSMGDYLISPWFDTAISWLLGYMLCAFIPFGIYIGAGNSLLYAPLFILWVFSFLDSRVSVSAFLKSFMRSFLLIVHRYPFIWFITFIITMLAALKSYVELSLITYVLSDSRVFPFVWLVFSDVFFFGVTLFLVLVLYSILSNVYTKQVHEHFDYYY